jgi:hypothetical protein
MELPKEVQLLVNHYLRKGRSDPKHQLIRIDPQKELEFWEWWLTEAIPKAWELASKTQLYFQKLPN